MSRRPHIVCFMPFAAWTLHSARAVTLLHALRLRGCTTTAVLCDGVFSDCDLRRAAEGRRRAANTCLVCQAETAGHFSRWGMPYRWLGRWLNQDDFTAAAAWVGSLRPAAYESATYQSWSLGSWVKTSVLAHLGKEPLDLNDPSVAAIYASYLNSAVLACLGLSRLYDEERPDAHIITNSALAVMRAAAEVAKTRGLRTLHVEKSDLPSHITLWDSADVKPPTALPFPLVTTTGVSEGLVAYKTLDALQPGLDPTLDIISQAVCRVA